VLTLCFATGWAGLDSRGPHRKRTGDTRYAIDIPAQNLGDALQPLHSRHTNKLLYSSDLVAGKTSSAIKGQFTTEEGVRRKSSRTPVSNTK